MPVSSDQIVRFDSFTLDPQHRLLSFNGESINLSPKQFDLLQYFVFNAGRTLSKDELLEAVWPGQFVEEGSLTQNVFWVRKALGRGLSGSEDGRRHIVTLPGKGYQFNFLSAPLLADEDFANDVGTEAVVSPAMPSAAGAVPIHPSAHTGRWLIAAAGLALLVTGFLIVRSRGATHRAERASAASSLPREVVLGQFTNSTDDPALKISLETALRIGLEQSPRLSIASEDDVRETLRFMQISPNASFTPTMAAELCERRGADTVVLGSIASAGGQYVIGVEGRSCSTKKIVSAEQATAGSKERVLATLSGLLPGLRTQLGESSASVRQYGASIEQATTPSLEAFKAYAAGNELRQQGDSIEAIPLYEHAIALDPHFAMAYARLGACYATLSERALSAAAYTRAYQLGGNLSQPEKFYIQSLYTHRVERNMFDTIRIHDEWRTLYPQDSHSWVSESDALTQMGRFDEAIRIAEAGYRRNPGDGMMAMALARAYQRSGRLDDLRRVAAEANSKGIESWDIHEMLWYRAQILGDEAAAQAEHKWVTGKSEEYQLLDDEADMLLEKGRWRESQVAWAKFEAEAKQQSMTGYADIDVGLYAMCLAEFGLRSQALATLKKWPSLTNTPEYARGLAAVGQAAEADAIMANLVKAHPHDTLLNLWHKPIMEAEIALAESGPDGARKALSALELANAIGMRDYAVPFLRGKAYLRLRRFPEASAQFRSIVDSPGVDPSSPLRTLALVGFARAQTMEKDSRTGKSAYEEILHQWTQADPDLPILIQVKAELDHLQGLIHAASN